MAIFDIAFDKTMKFEGGYSNNPTDYGKETYKGVSRKYHPTWRGWLIIDSYKNKPNFPLNLDKDAELQKLIRIFYKEEFWDKLLGDQIVEQKLADELFDTAVNMSPNNAIKYLQSALNILNRNKKDYDDIDEDGVIGSSTLSTINAYMSKRKNIEVLLTVMNVLQGMRYIEIMKNNPSQEEFAFGWFNDRIIMKKG